jgi:hypothetical protein
MIIVSLAVTFVSVLTSVGDYGVSIHALKLDETEGLISLHDIDPLRSDFLALLVFRISSAVSHCQIMAVPQARNPCKRII